MYLSITSHSRALIISPLELVVAPLELMIDALKLMVCPLELLSLVALVPLVSLNPEYLH